MTNSPFPITITTETFLRFFLVLIGILTLFYVRDVVLMVLAAIVIASGIEPITKWFVKNGFPRIASVIVIYLSMIIFMIGFFYLVFPLLIKQTNDVLSQIPSYIENVSASTSTNPFFSLVPKEALNVEFLLQRFQAFVSDTSSSIVGFVGTLFGGIFSALLIFVLSFYLSVMDNGVSHFLKVITPPTHVAYVINVWERSRIKMGLWLQGQLILCLFVGFFIYVGLTLLGVPNALFLALIGGVLEIIPMFGPIISAIPALLIATTADGVKLALFVGLMYIIIQQIENHILVPLVLKKVIGLPSIMVILSLLIGAKIAGFIGMLIAVPMAAIVMELYDDIEKKRNKTPQQEASSVS